MADVIIIGGGASGMAAAVEAARGGEHRLTVLERQSRVGRKLLATGNGRCNLTNTAAAPEHYFGADGAKADFTAGVLRRFTPGAVLDRFAGLSLKTTVEYGGRVYPYSGSAASVLDVLRLNMEKFGVNVVTGAAVESVHREKGAFSVSWSGGSARADKVIVACGGCAGGKLGGVKDGYRLLESLGHSVTPLRPALCPIRTEAEYPRALKGIRVSAGARLLADGKIAATARGDVLFTETGLSGSAIFDLSLYSALHAKAKGQQTALNFFPDDTPEQVAALLRARIRAWPELEANRVFTGLLQSRLGMMLCKRAGIGGGRAAKTLTDGELAALSREATDFRLSVTGSGGLDNAQVTVGGAKTKEFDPETLESRLVPGLYACGEVLDVAAPCGGYNLHWAWASGLAAGELR